MIPKSKLYKLVIGNIQVKEGSKRLILKDLIKARQYFSDVFIGLGDGSRSTVGEKWEK